MPSVQLQPFHRRDRQQLADLVNAHAAAVVPGAGVSVAALLSHLEREPGEFVVDPWVRERVTLMARQNDRVAAAAHLLRYGDDEHVGPDYRNSGEIRWLLFWPQAPASENPYWTDGTRAATDLMAACLAQMSRWAVTARQAGGELPVPGVYGVPEQWPHVAALYERAGFAHDGHTEAVYLAQVPELPRPARPPLAGLAVRRSVGLSGTRLSAVLEDEVIGYIEVEVRAETERLARHAGWADVGNLHVSDRYRRRRVATWLVGQAAEWLALAQVSRLLDYAWVDGAGAPGNGDADHRAFLASLPFTELTRTRRGWTKPVP